MSLDLDSWAAHIRHESSWVVSPALKQLDEVVAELRASRNVVAIVQKMRADKQQPWRESTKASVGFVMDAELDAALAELSSINVSREIAPDWKPGDDPQTWMHGYVEHISYPGICGVEINPENGDRCGRPQQHPIHGRVSDSGE